MDSTNLHKETALAYAARGWHVFPLYTVRKGNIERFFCTCGKALCDSPGKHPRTPHGLKDATTDPAEIGRYWVMWPEANVGIATGKGSGLSILLRTMLA